MASDHGKQLGFNAAHVRASPRLKAVPDVDVACAERVSVCAPPRGPNVTEEVEDVICHPQH
eukprot:3128160-Rhodomonas_salina.3